MFLIPLELNQFLSKSFYSENFVVNILCSCRSLRQNKMNLSILLSSLILTQQNSILQFLGQLLNDLVIFRLGDSHWLIIVLLDYSIRRLHRILMPQIVHQLPIAYSNTFWSIHTGEWNKKNFWTPSLSYPFPTQTVYHLVSIYLQRDR